MCTLDLKLGTVLRKFFYQLSSSERCDLIVLRNLKKFSNVKQPKWEKIGYQILGQV